MTELSTKYNPKEVEDRIYKFWQDNNLFSAKTNSKKNPFCIVIPPPNITGVLHMGHALNNTIQDILIRYKRMQGFETLWMPGTDHAGIATQNAVERELAKEGKRRQDIGRDEFLKKLWSWKEEYGDTIIQQLEKLGASCDWSRTRFTMDEHYSEAIKEVFVRLYEKGLIYQGEYIINWCPRCQTALSDEEAQHKEVKGALYYFRYPFKDNPKKYVVLATTRPETMLGDTAVAVNPKDKRYKELVGKVLILPLIEREIKIIADSAVDPKFGTGCVKVTPAHDPNDFEIAKRHNLEFINIMRPDGTLNNNAGEFEGMDRFEARQAILEVLEEKKLLERTEAHMHAVGHCYRCHTIVEPYLSKQWFVKMKPLAKPAIAMVKKGKIKFIPNRWTKVYLNWMENIRDWCISRQIWWGHRIPVWYCQDCPDGQNVVVSRDRPDTCPKCDSYNLVQDEDVLDTWFSSWLWPFATFYWPNNSEDLKYFYPTSVLVTAPEIIFFWVARMIMAGLEFMGDIPFKDVYIHGTVRDQTGVKMSKSLGNIIDPLEIIDGYGTDALRFSLIAITATGTDVFLSKEKFELGRNFANKIWNASRLILMNLKEKSAEHDLCQIYAKEQLALPERWILSRLYSIIDKVNRAIDKYRFNEAGNLLYEFFWHEFCDWYLEIIKERFSDKNSQIIAYKILEKSLRMLHPFMPFITEEIWQRFSSKSGPIATQGLPHLQRQMIDGKTESQMQILINLITTIRNVRANWNVDNYKKIDIVLRISDSKIRKILEKNSNIVKNLAKIENLTIKKSIRPPANSARGVVEKIDFCVPLVNIIDISKEKERIKNQIKNQRELLVAINKRLKNKQFLKKAPKEVVLKEKKRQEELKEKVIKLKKIIKDLK
ncbi:MAG: valine--tRNA ligase [Candidatus Omnitrophica bacterium]|nr:valine--tRNA ligase [Candidatus Omnitrophota bacterium]